MLVNLCFLSRFSKLLHGSNWRSMSSNWVGLLSVQTLSNLEAAVDAIQALGLRLALMKESAARA